MGSVGLRMKYKHNVHSRQKYDLSDQDLGQNPSIIRNNPVSCLPHDVLQLMDHSIVCPALDPFSIVHLSLSPPYLYFKIKVTDIRPILPSSYRLTLVSSEGSTTPMLNSM